jgi:hypothetical protein
MHAPRSRRYSPGHPMADTAAGSATHSQAATR